MGKHSNWVFIENVSARTVFASAYVACVSFHDAFKNYYFLSTSDIIKNEIFNRKWLVSLG